MKDRKKVYRKIMLDSDERVLRDVILLPGDKLILIFRSEKFMRLRVLGSELSIEPEFSVRNSFLFDEINVGS